MWNFDDFFERFWYSYPNDLCHYRKGSKAKAKIAAAKRVKTEEEAKRIEAATEAWARYSRYEKQKTKYTDRWPHVTVWFNQERYDCDIPPYTEVEDKEKPKPIKLHQSHEMRKPLTQPKADPNKARLHLETIKGMIK